MAKGKERERERIVVSQSRERIQGRLESSLEFRAEGWGGAETPDCFSRRESDIAVTSSFTLRSFLTSPTLPNQGVSCVTLNLNPLVKCSGSEAVPVGPPLNASGVELDSQSELDFCQVGDLPEPSTFSCGSEKPSRDSTQGLSARFHWVCVDQ